MEEVFKAMFKDIVAYIILISVGICLFIVIPYNIAGFNYFIAAGFLILGLTMGIAVLLPVIWALEHVRSK